MTLHTKSLQHTLYYLESDARYLELNVVDLIRNNDQRGVGKIVKTTIRVERNVDSFGLLRPVCCGKPRNGARSSHERVISENHAGISEFDTPPTLAAVSAAAGTATKPNTGNTAS